MKKVRLLKNEIRPFEPESFLILVVDDVTKNLQLVMEILEQIGYETTFATSGKKALERLETVKPDLILLDLMMPDMGGLEVCQILKSDPRYQKIPVIFLTASNEQENLIDAFEKGAVDYVTKPFHSAELLARVRTHLELKQARDDLHEAYEILESLVVVDPLTGVANRRAIDAFAKEEYERAQRYKTEFSVLMIDLDYFKNVNDLYGHYVGDECLKIVAEKLNDSLRAVDQFGRFGGEEFVAILPQTNLTEAIKVAERLRIAVNQLVPDIKDFSTSLSISIGVSAFEEKDQVLMDIFIRADKALYEAKAMGRNLVRTNPSEVLLEF
jgi:diguanylate cyclase (GGDEF)-like protein